MILSDLPSPAEASSQNDRPCQGFAQAGNRYPLFGIMLQSKGTLMPEALADARYQLALANRIIAHEGVLDGFGHVSIRHPDRPDRYLLARSRSPELIEPSDILEFTLDSEPVKPPKGDMYGERVIHGCIYQARPDVNAVCHHHSPSVLPFCITGAKFEPVFHMGAVMGQVVPMWDS